MRRLTAALAAALLLLVPATAAADPTQESTFQDDPLLVYGDEATVKDTLDRLQGLGVDRLRVSVFWKLVAPQPEADRKPAGFDGSDPVQYGPDAFTRYDRIINEAALRGMSVNLNITLPGPKWGTGEPPADRPDLEDTWLPDVAEWGRFVAALGKRFPDQRYWSIGNEPNQAGWLTPQWAPDPRNGGALFPFAPHVYRQLVDAAWASLGATGHTTATDTILIGETAPKGLLDLKGPTRSLDSVRFIKAMYCLDDDLQPFRGTSAEVRGCPVGEAVARFPQDHPALFGATGFAHHPYELTFAPNKVSPHPDRWITTANLGDLTRLLKRIRQRYAQDVRTNVPIYLTEFGYQTNPPDRFGVSRTVQAQHLNHAEYLTYRNRDVRTLAQFLLLDDGEPITRTFQSGLMTRDGRKKPSFNAYLLPVWLPQATVRRGKRLKVWGLVRAGRPGTRERVLVQVRRAGSTRWRTVRTTTSDARRGYLTTTLGLGRGKGHVRLRWTSPGGQDRVSRSARYVVR